MHSPFKISQDAIDDLQHNINNPLTIIQGRVQYLKENPTPEEIASVKRIVKNQIDRIVKYLKHLEPDILIQPTNGE